MKTLILPVLNHIIITLPNPTQDILKKVSELIFTFIWNSPVHRVIKKLLQKDFCEGGIKMINLNLFILALKTTWVRKLFRTECKWDNILFSTINQEKIFNFGNGYISYIKENVKNKFWKNVFHAWYTFIDKEENFTWEYFLSSPLWMNKTIKIENKPVFYEDWFRKGICFVNDIMSEDGKFLSIDQLEEKFNISKYIMKFNSIISAVKHAGKQNVYNSYKLLTPFIPSFVKTILKSKRGTKDMYLLLIRNNIVSNGQKKWEEI